MNKALVIGHTGQDGFYLVQLLQEKGYEVVGISSTAVSENQYDIKHVDITSSDQVEVCIEKFKPDHIYFMAAVHQSSSDTKWADGELFKKSFQINVIGLLNFLEGIKRKLPQSKLFYAASSHVFGQPLESPQNEQTPFAPECIYGITKTTGIQMCRYYQKEHNVFSVVGILYNHESPRRASKYVSKKIVEAAVQIKSGNTNQLILGDLSSRIDWGYALDYMKGIVSLMEQDKGGEFVISAEDPHTINDLVEIVFSELDLDWTKYVKTDSSLITKKQKTGLTGKADKIRNLTGWSPEHSFADWIKIMVADELKKNGN